MSAQVPVPALIVRGLAAAALVVALAGCGDEPQPLPPEPGVVTPPVVTPPDTAATVAPETAVRALVDSWNDRDPSRYVDLLTEDYVFVFAPSDTAGGEEVFGREQERISSQHLFVGGGAEPPANLVLFVINPVLQSLPDSRPGKDPTVHKEIATSFDLTVTTPEKLYHFSGGARFFVVRGDSAHLPAEALPRGLVADARHWYVERWTDESNPGSLETPSSARPAGVLASRPHTVGDLKRLYLPFAPRASNP